MSRTVVHYGFWALKITVVLEPEKRGDGRWFRFWFYHYGDWSLTGYIVSGIETLYESLAGTLRIKGRKLGRPFVFMQGKTHALSIDHRPFTRTPKLG